MTIRELSERINKNSRRVGWYDNGPIPIPTHLMLLVTEAGEAMDEYRSHVMGSHIDSTGEPMGFPSELADIAILLFDIAYANGYDLEQEILDKTAYNETRSHKHGGKLT